MVVFNIAFAVLYMTKDVTITGGVSVVGAIEVYEDDGTTLMTSIPFPNFTGGQAGGYEEYFWINNTGNQPLEVYWNISSSTINPWDPDVSGYRYLEISNKYRFEIWIDVSPANKWSPNDHTVPGNVSLAVGEGRRMQARLSYTGLVVTAELFTFTMSFYAQDA